MAGGALRVSETDDLVAALSPVADAFRGLGISFYVGGSIASTFHGAIRSTMDVDLVCDLTPELVDAFVGTFGTDFYVSAAAVRDAVQRRSCFNLIHMPTAYKVDVRPWKPSVSVVRSACQWPPPRIRSSASSSGFGLPTRHRNGSGGMSAGLWTCTDHGSTGNTCSRWRSPSGSAICFRNCFRSADACC